MTVTPAASLHPDTLALAEEVVALRREFHRHPELDFDLPWTAGRVAGYLRELGLEVHTGIGRSGVVGLLAGARPGPTALYRADMDALPLQEETGLPFASEIPGRMHACGHDGHTAVGLVLAKLLHSRRAALPGRVAFLFQPAEEGAGGAQAMIEDGVLDLVKPDACFAMHLNNDEEYGEVGVHPGPVFAGSGEFFVTLTSSGGHGAAPHRTVDLIVVAAQMITALQSVVARTVDPLATVVVTVGQVQIGTKTNILPTTGSFAGTIRYYDAAENERVVRRVDELLGGIARAHGAGYSFRYEPGYPATVNDPAVAALARAAIAPLARITDFRTMGSEDMSHFLARVPGCYYNVGSRNPAKGKVHGHHSGSFDIDEDALVLAVEAGARVLEAYLGGGAR